jgi:hypothetical protein
MTPAPTATITDTNPTGARAATCVLVANDDQGVVMAAS